MGRLGGNLGPLGYGFDADDLETEVEPFSREDLFAPDDPGAGQALSLLNCWLELTTVLNELVRSMGQPDFYPFVMSKQVVRKLHFVHLVVVHSARVRGPEASAQA